MAESGGAAKFFKYGCLGCLGLVGFVIAVIAVMGGTAYLSVRSETLETKVLTRDLAGTSGDDTGAAPGGRPGADAGASSGNETDLHRARTGTFAFEMSGGEFEIVPGEPGDPIAVEASFDPDNGELEESFVENDDGTWSYTVRFNGQSSGLKGLFREIMGKDSQSVRIKIPPDIPMNVDFRVAQGGGTIELGGLWLDSANLELYQGGVELSVSEPTREPMSRFDIRASMGGGSFISLGNASPAEMDLTARMGGFEVDLTGEWVQDSAITINATMGGTEIRLPRDVNIEGHGGFEIRGDSGVMEKREEELPRPTLTLSSSASMGGIDVYYE